MGILRVRYRVARFICIDYFVFIIILVGRGYFILWFKLSYRGVKLFVKVILVIDKYGCGVVFGRVDRNVGSF